MSQVVIKPAFYAGLFLSSFFNSSLMAEQLPTVVVSSTRSQQATTNVSSSIKIITRAQIESSGASSLTEVLRGQMGIHLTGLFGDGTNASVSMRGTNSASNVLFIIDGRRINNIDLNGPNLNSVSIKNIEQIEIIQGSAGTLYGDQAVGGVVNVITKKPENYSLDFELFTGNFGRNRVATRLENRIKNGLSYQISADFLRADNYRDNNKLDSMDVLGRIDYEFSTGSVFAEHSRIKDEQELPGSLLAAEVAANRRQSFSGFVNDYSDTETEVTRVGLISSLSDIWSAEVEFTLTDSDKDVQNSFRTFTVTSPSTINSKQKEFTPRLIANIPMNGSELLATLGADLRDTDYSSTVTNIIDEQKVTSFYGQLVIPVHTKVSVTVGGRHSSVENDVEASFKTGEVNDRATVYETGIKFNLNSNLNVFARVDENFRFAKVDELTYTPPGEELDNQRGRSKELGVEFNGNDLSMKAFVSRLELKDEIAFDPTALPPAGAPAFFGPGANVNLGSTIHDSVIIDAQYKLNKSLDIMMNLTSNDAVFDSGVDSGNAISGVPDRIFTLASNYRYSDAMLTYAELIYTGEQFKSGDNANAVDKLGSYTVVNLNAEYSWKEWTYAIRINNLLNREYAESVNVFGSINPSPERNFWFSASVRFE